MAPSAPVAATARTPFLATVLEGLRGDTTFSRMQAAGMLAGGAPQADEPLRAEIAKALESMLTEPKDELREPPEAARALVKWATIDNVPALAVAAWSENSFVSQRSKQALDRLKDEADPETRKAIDDAINRGREVVIAQAIPRALKAARGGDHSSRLNALKQLAREPVDPNYQDAVVSTVLNLFDDNNAFIQDNALAVLGVWARPSDLPAIRALLDHPNLGVRSMAIRALTRTKDPEAIDKIVALADERRLERDVRTAVQSYGSAAEPALLNLLANGSDAARASVCRLLESVGTELCLPALREAQATSDARLQSAARRAIRTLERKLGLPSGEMPKPARKPRTRSNTKQGGAQ